MYSLLIHLLIIYSSESVTVQPAPGNPASDLVPWPELTNKVLITFQCPRHHVKFSLSSSSNALIGNVELYGTGKAVGVFCKGAGSKSWYDGEKWSHSVGATGPCTGITGPEDTLTIEWTDTGVKLMRDEEVIISQVWGSTDGNCLSEKTAYWRIQNYGSTVISARNYLSLGTY